MPTSAIRSRLWLAFQTSTAWRILRRVSLFRSLFYLIQELHAALMESRRTTVSVVDRDFTEHVDPFCYMTNPVEQQRFELQRKLLDDVRGAARFGRALEIGCAEGAFTSSVGERCHSLVVLDVSPTALARTRAVVGAGLDVEFVCRDVRRDPLAGPFHLIVVAGVLEYFTRPLTFRRLRTKLVEALAPEGYLLIESTRANVSIEGAWWGRYLVRGRWINVFMSRHPALESVREIVTDTFVISLFRRTA